jgi:Ras-related GTP-binding protein A/B
MESYFGSHKEDIFTNVSTMIYVFDLNSASEEQDYEDYVKCVEYLKECSKQAKIFCLFHKLDLIPADQRERLVEYKRQHIQKISEPFQITAFGTSIWHDSLYKAWSSIVYTLIPNSTLIQEHLQHFTDGCEAEEVVLFEKATFLDVSHASHSSISRFEFKDPHRFEKMSNVVKMFKLSCARVSGNSVRSIELHNSDINAFIYEFTSTTYIMVIVSDSDVKPAATLMNINLARPHFEKLLRPNI